MLRLDVVTAHRDDVGYDVVPAITAEIALDILMSGNRIDILFTDIRLPGAMDGWQPAEAAREIRPTLPVIYATGFSQTPSRMVEGAVFFQIPGRAIEFLGSLARLIGQAAASAIDIDSFFINSR